MKKEVKKQKPEDKVLREATENKIYGKRTYGGYTRDSIERGVSKLYQKFITENVKWEMSIFRRYFIDFNIKPIHLDDFGFYVRHVDVKLYWAWWDLSFDYEQGDKMVVHLRLER